MLNSYRGFDIYYEGDTVIIKGYCFCTAYIYGGATEERIKEDIDKHILNCKWINVKNNG